jgi:hypothetical protein
MNSSHNVSSDLGTANANYSSSLDAVLHHSDEGIWQFQSSGGGGVMNFLLGVTPTSNEYGKRRIEFDYIYILYILIVINILVLLPSYTRYVLSSSRSSYGGGRRLRSKLKKETTQKDDDDDNNNNNNNNNNGISSHQKQQLAHTTLLYTYLPAYLLATCADWLQGPYKYALYTGYGYTQREIAHLFVAGYGSGMILGSVIGGLADSYGRKRLCICYCACYTISVLLKHFKCYTVLLVGRIFGGIATSLLFSVFDSWFIGAHGHCGLVVGTKDKEDDERYLAKSLSISTYGSSIVAIMSGVIANRIVAVSGTIRPINNNNYMLSSHIYVGGYISAFDACLVPLTLCAIMILLFWEENYGESMEVRKKDKKSSLSSASSSFSNSDGDCSMMQISQRRKTSIVRKDSSTIFEDDEQIEQVEDDDDDCATSAKKREYATLRTTVIEIDQDDDYDSTITTLRKQQQQQSNSNSGRGMLSNLLDGAYTVWNSTEILICCIVSSIFEGIMYIFIFLWTPTLTSLQMKLDTLHGISVTNSTAILTEQSTTTSTTKDMHHGEGSDLPFGYIFSTFMVSCMLGTIAFSRLSHAGVSASKCLVGVLALSSLSCLAMAHPISYMTSKSTSSANTYQYIGMLVYEFCIGFYYPAMGTVKGSIVPESQRAAIYNVFRFPLNLFMLTFLVGTYSTEASFTANAVLLMMACMLQIYLVRLGGK